MKEEELNKYPQHLPSCNIMQDWSEAEMAFADTPTHLRDGEWNEARHEMDLKRNTCTCGLKEMLDKSLTPSPTVPKGTRSKVEILDSLEHDAESFLIKTLKQ